MSDKEYWEAINERAKGTADVWRSSWGTDYVQNYNEVVREPSLFSDILLVEGGKRLWADVAADLAKAITARKKEEDEIQEAMFNLGFSFVGTGGGCEAFQFGGDPPDYWPHFLVTNEDAGTPDTWDEESTIGYYPSEEGEWTTETYDTMRELVDLLRKGKGHPEWKGGVRTASAAAVPQDDLEVINRHRSGLGMGPIDPAAGWTATELADMAENIRKTGRMANPRSAELKRRLMR